VKRAVRKIEDCRFSIVDLLFDIGVRGLDMTSEQMRARTKAFAVRVMKLVDSLPRGMASQVVGRQLLRSATSVGANYRAACRAQSRAEFAAKLSIVVEEADEALYWLELVQETQLLKPELLRELIKEANELVAIALTSRRTAKSPIRTANRTSTIENRQL
jgi:four helix bundle protein